MVDYKIGRAHTHDISPYSHWVISEKTSKVNNYVGRLRNFKVFLQKKPSWPINFSKVFVIVLRLGLRKQCTDTSLGVGVKGVEKNSWVFHEICEEDKQKQRKFIHTGTKVTSSLQSFHSVRLRPQKKNKIKRKKHPYWKSRQLRCTFASLPLLEASKISNHPYWNNRRLRCYRCFAPSSRSLKNKPKSFYKVINVTSQKVYMCTIWMLSTLPHFVGRLLQMITFKNSKSLIILYKPFLIFQLNITN